MSIGVPYVISYKPSRYLRGVTLCPESSYWDYFRENARCNIQFLALCEGPIQYVTSVTGAKHEYLVVSVGIEPSKAFKKGFIFKKQQSTAEFIILEFAKNEDRSVPTSGVISITQFDLSFGSNQTIAEAFCRKAKTKGIKHIDTHVKNVSGVNLGDAVFLATAVASAGYDVVNHNCRHFARTLFSSLKFERAVVESDGRHKMLRKMAKWLGADSGGSLVSSSYSASATLQLTGRLMELAAAVATGSVVEIAMELALNHSFFQEAYKMVSQVGGDGYLKCAQVF